MEFDKHLENRDDYSFKPFETDFANEFIRQRPGNPLGLRIGDLPSGNYIDIATDGELTLVGTARITKHLDLANASFTKGNTAPTEVIIGEYTAWEFDIGDDAHMDFVVPHEWDSSTDITVKYVWYVNEAYATNSGEVNWQLMWSACPTDNTEAIDSPTHTGTDSSGDVNIPANAKYLTITTVETIPAASLAAGDIIGIEVSRIALVGGANPTADPAIVDIHVEYTANKLGEAT